MGPLSVCRECSLPRSCVGRPDWEMREEGEGVRRREEGEERKEEGEEGEEREREGRRGEREGERGRERDGDERRGERRGREVTGRKEEGGREGVADLFSIGDKQSHLPVMGQEHTGDIVAQGLSQFCPF